MSLDFYDSNGNPIAYSDDGEHIYTFSGRAVAYLNDGSVYSYGGAHLGRFSNGLIRDNNGSVVFFTDGASGGPLKPLKTLKPLKGLKALNPLKSVRALRPVKPLDSNGWSQFSGEQFFR